MKVSSPSGVTFSAVVGRYKDGSIEYNVVGNVDLLSCLSWEILFDFRLHILLFAESRVVNVALQVSQGS